MRFFSKWQWQHWLVAITILGVLLRLSGFGRVPVSLYWDEMAAWNDALSIAETGRDLFDRSWLQPIFISYGDFKLPVFIWAVTFFSFTTQNPLIAVRLPSLLAGISMIPAVYILANAIFPPEKKKLPLFALMSAGVLAILPWSLHFSQVGYEGHLGAAFLLWSLACLFLAPKAKRSNILLSVAALLGVLSVYSYFSVRFVWPVIVLASLVLFWQHFKKHWKGILLVLVVWMLALIPMYKADFYEESNKYRLSASNVLNNPDRVNQVNLYRERAGNNLLSRVVYNNETFIIRDLAGQYLEYLNPNFLFLSGDPNLRHGIGQAGVLWLSFLPFVLAGFIYLVREKPRVLFWLSIWWVFATLPAAVPLDVPHALRSLNALPVWVLLVSYGAMYLWRWLESGKLSKILKISILGGCAVFLLLEIVRYQAIFLTSYPVVSADEWQDGYIELARYIQKASDEYEVVYVDSFDDRFFLYYQPFSGMTYKEIQKLPSEGFKRDVFDNVRIRAIDDWLFLQQNSVVITTPDRLPEGWQVTQSFKDMQGKDRFVVVETHRVQ
jgi:4-amino-4-deoxy-L-arabinose transferase-like glycosyltransferase